MKGTLRPAWSINSSRVPDSINSQLIGTFPSIVEGDDGKAACAFFVRATEDEFTYGADWDSTTCLMRPQFVKTPQGPIIVACCMVSAKDNGVSEPFISETAIFPRLSNMSSHRTITDMLVSGGQVYFVVCDETGKCLFNSKAHILEEWRSELAAKGKGFDDGKQITDEKSAIMSLYWYQERDNPSSKIFEVRH